NIWHPSRFRYLVLYFHRNFGYSGRFHLHLLLYFSIFNSFVTFQSLILLLLLSSKSLISKTSIKNAPTLTFLGALRWRF
ncbi:hypothetical protein VIGAN_11188200, partial [Vigna angularis var. angularis]